MVFAGINKEVLVYGQKTRLLLVAWTLILMVGCAPIRPLAPGAPAQQATPGEVEPATGGLTLSLTTTITQENTVTVTLPSSSPMVEQAIKDLARRLALSLDQITLVSAEAVVWPDAGLGCPQPGMAY